ncbi:hypothetical protein [Pseudarthrobacter sp. BIM B-2242]|uniref:hypothetical protein n=1 Tax=Pseudarthrobacter sp. BIM B-2242 TaxID=2772401 RepID=UPI00168B2C1A|nr:hypothetical protein [Pseudarthrobacter sp. BIM B-2242]QOD05940.1 hypothetical protein IDT60_20440 [Pseudarthrobacter sp. BIM B-2242]
MKPMPHVHTYVLNGKGERISRCLHSEDHHRAVKYALRRRLLTAARAIFAKSAWR